MSEPEQQAVIDPLRAIRVRTSTGWADLAIKGADGVGVPPGGTPGQLLTKDTVTNFSTKWSDAPVALPPGGAVGQSLTKKTAADGDAQWTTLDNLHYLGDYAAGSFVEGDVVVYQGVAYVCTKPTSSSPAAWPGAPPVVQPPPTVTGYGTSLPTNPYDGQEHVLVDSTTAPNWQWRLRYNAAATSAYKWEFVGGLPYFDARGGTAGGAAGSTTPIDVPGGPVFTAPRLGDYKIVFGCYLQNDGTWTSGPYFMYGQLAQAGTLIGYQCQVGVGAAYVGASCTSVAFPTGVPAGVAINMRYWVDRTGNSGHLAFPWMQVFPQRLS